MKNYQREYDEYHKGHDHGAHTHEGCNFGACYRNDCDVRQRYLWSMNAFYENGSYGDEPMVERSLMDSGDIVGREQIERIVMETWSQNLMDMEGHCWL